MNTISIYTGHDANISLKVGDEYKIYELEKLFKIKHFHLSEGDNNSWDYFAKNIKLSLDYILDDLKIENDFDLLCLGYDHDYGNHDQINKFINFKSVKKFHHHLSHAACAFYQSPFEKSIVISYDGGGSDGCFVIYLADKKNNTFDVIKKVSINFGQFYLFCAACVPSLQNTGGLDLSGKFMGLCAYGDVNNKFENDIYDMLYNTNYDKVSILKNKIFECTRINESDEYDFAATVQHIFETEFLKQVTDIINLHEYPICVTGGCALSVLVNQKLSEIFKRKVFVPPNPNDCGLSLGQLFLGSPPLNTCDISSFGMKFNDEITIYNSQIIKQESSLEDLARLIKSGKIIGFIHGNIENGPRALGNRSILCDPSFPMMKDVLNSKVKFREWYRPFAPVCLKIDANKYFDINDNLSYSTMSFAPKVKKHYVEKLSSVTHIDHTARLQTIDDDNHPLYKLLVEYSKISKISVLLNTSFNIRGRPILNSIDDALNVIIETDIDYLYYNGYIYKKK
jgi:carbamoyltransferase